MPNPGERFGPYDILAPLGAGGMGVVFRARDSRLGREVALKTLSPEVTRDATRLARFEQEAQAASALNHPNVLSIFDVGRQGDTPYLVTELLEGETLRARLERGALPMRKALDVVTQVARGLAAVHAKGVVHRDLKPENLFLTHDGHVKILDFGVARVTEAATPATGTLPLTQDGAVMGTAGYMSPEQVRGHPADARSDLFALGVIFFECLTGTQAFPGETPVERGYAILNAEPRPLPPSTPPGLARIVQRCLEKSVEERFQHAKDLVFALESVSESGAQVTLPAPPTPRWPLLVAVAALLLAGAFGLWVRPTKAAQVVVQSPAPPPTPTVPAPPATITSRRVTFRNGHVINARFAADGRGIVYAGIFEGSAPRVYAGVLDGPQLRTVSTPLTTLLDVSSKDELALGDLKEDETRKETRGGMVLSRASLAGGAARPLHEGVVWADFGGDDSLLVTRFDGKQFTLEYPPGHVILTDRDGLAQARLSPSGKLIAFLRYPVPGDDRGTVDIVDLEGKLVTRSTPAWTVDGMAWAPGGDAVWFSAGYTSVQRALWALPVSGGGEQRVYGMPGSLHLLDIDEKGRVLATVGLDRTRIFGRVADDARERPLSWLDGSMPIDLSDDGRAMLFLEGYGPAGTEVQTWLRTFDDEDSAPVQLSLGYGRALSRDKRWALVSPTPPFTTLRLVPTGPGAVRDLPPGDFQGILSARFFADGQRVLVTAIASDGQPHVYVQSVVTGSVEGATGPLPVSEAGLIATTPPSPDGAQFAGLTVPGREAVLVSTKTGEVRPLGLTQGLVPVQWSTDGRSLYLARRPQRDSFLSYQLSRLELASGKVSSLLAPIGPTDTVGMLGVKGGLVTPDAKHYVYMVRQSLDELYLLEGLTSGG